MPIGTWQKALCLSNDVQSDHSQLGAKALPERRASVIERRQSLLFDGAVRHALLRQMATAPDIQERPATIAPASDRGNGVDFSQPVRRPRKSAFQLLREVLNHGGPGYLQFAITNICNAKCDFCGFAVDRFDPKQRRSVTLPEARDVIDIAVKNHIGYLLFVGGEPLVHKDLREMTRYAAERGIHPMICSNGSLWTEQNMRGLASDGLSSVIMSIDAHDIAKHEKNRGLPEVCRKIKHANEVFAELGIQTTASVTASKLIDEY